MKHTVRYSLLSLVCATLFNLTLQAQISSGGIPKAVAGGREIPVIDLSGKGLTENEILAHKPAEKNGPLEFAVATPVDIDTYNNGIWQTAPDGTRIWQVLIRCKEARSLSLTFDRYRLEKGERLFVFNPDGTHTLGAFTEKNNKKSGALALAPLKGNTALVSLEIPPGRPENGNIHIGRVGLGYLDIFPDKAAKDAYFGASGPCNVDINCTEGADWQVEKNSVVRILVNGETASYLCTGVLMNTVSNDATPYILTASHCITDSAGAANSVFVFGYESPYCNGPDGSVIKSVSGSELKASGGNNLDFTLVQMSQIPPFTYYPYYAGWNSSAGAPTSSVAIHHPNGDVKKISLDNDAPVIASYDVYDDNTFWQVLQWDVGTTEPGSSGGPLFDQNHRVIGTLSGGDARCGNSVNDYFEMLHYSWDTYPETNRQVKRWLDPDQLGFPFWNGYDPYEVSKKTCDTLTNIADGETLLMYPYGGPDDGYWSGHNIARASQFAELFYNSQLFSMTGIYIMPGIISFDSPLDKITVKIWEYDTAPGNVIVQKDVPMNFFRDSVWNFIDFDTIVTVPGNFFAGFEVYYDSPSGPLTDEFAVMQVEARNVYGENFAYYYQNSQWSTYSGTPPDYRYTSLAIQPVLCGEMPAVGIRKQRENALHDGLVVYPNPAGREITLRLPVSVSENARVEISDISGRKIFSRTLSITGNSASLLLPSVPEGIYILRLTTQRGDYRTRIVLRNH